MPYYSASFTISMYLLHSEIKHLLQVSLSTQILSRRSCSTRLNDTATSISLKLYTLSNERIDFTRIYSIQLTLVFFIIRSINLSKRYFSRLQVRSMVSVKTPEKSPPLSFFDIGMNATDPQFRGNYRSKQKHESDFDLMHKRSLDAGCAHWLVTGGDLVDSREAFELSQSDGAWFSTAGVHPTRSNMAQEYPGGLKEYMKKLKAFIQENSERKKIKAFGELGLDYDRLDWSPKETQVPVFAAQLELAFDLQLPLFLHSRACEEDFLRMLIDATPRLPLRGVVHSFTGSLYEMQELTRHGWSIGVNGCSLKTTENLAVVKEIPMSLLMLETDAPWCDIRPSHAGHHFLKMSGAPQIPESKKVERFEMGQMVRSRNEPCTIQHVAWIVAHVKEIEYEQLVSQVYRNTMNMFG